MTTVSRFENNLEQSQDCEQRESDLLLGGLGGDEIEAADLGADNAVKTQANLEQLNQSTISDLEKFANDNLAGDLWLRLREATRRYKAKRAEYTEKPAVESKSGFLLASIPDTDQHFNHIINAEGDISILWPLVPSLASLLHITATSGTRISFHTTQQTTISRSALSDLLNKGEVLFYESPRAVVRIATDMVAKIGRSDDVTEVMNLRHIRTASHTIPVPEPLGMLLIARNSYIFTTFVQGLPLDRIWANLTCPQKANIRQQLNAIFTELRTLPIPSKDGYLGGGDPPFCHDTRRWIRKSPSPIVSEAQFNDFLMSEAHTSVSHVKFVRACLRNDHRIVMTHGDLHPRNLLVNNEREVSITGAIDWESGGGYPEYWEYVKALHTAFVGDEDDWHLFLPENAIGKFIDEYARDGIVGRMVS